MGVNYLKKNRLMLSEKIIGLHGKRLSKHIKNTAFLKAVLIQVTHFVTTDFQPFSALCLLYVPPALTLINPTLCPHSAFMCFVWISEQTAIISLYNIN